MLKLEENNKFQKAIRFLTKSIGASGKNSKPVLEHSLRVAEYLYTKDYSEDVVIGAILHDILEDTAVTSDEIRDKFGIMVANLVEVNSFDKSIKDKIAQYKKMFERCLNAGRNTLIIKAVDILDNSHYCHLAETDEMRKMLMKKMKYFIDLSTQVIKNDIVWRDLNKQYEFLQTQK